MKPSVIYQTLDTFLSNPFGHPINSEKLKKFNASYTKFINENKIKFVNHTIIDDSYFIHIKIPSESKDGIFYDIVIQFFTEVDDIKTDYTLDRYYVQFFSNSPSFIYQYSALYRTYGYLINALYDKLSEENAFTLPDKVNPNYNMEIDKSLYIACRYLRDYKTTYMSKTSIKKYNHVPFKRFLSSITSFEIVQADLEFASVEKAIQKEIKDDSKHAKENSKTKDQRIRNKVHVKEKIKSKLDTLRDSPKGITRIKKKPKK